MKNVTAVVNNPKTSKKNNRQLLAKKEGNVDKFVASINNTQFNLSIEYFKKNTSIETTPTVKEFSIGYTLKELHVNDKQKNQLKTSDKNNSAMSIFYNFINKERYDLSSLEDIKINKVVFFKNYKIYFYGVTKTQTTKINIKSSKVAEIYLVAVNLLKQIRENEEMIEILKNNRKNRPFDDSVKKSLEHEVRTKMMLKTEFINMTRNFLKRYF
ncbi:MAG: hypothetical protein ACTHME_08625 [Candidatus Nitrosocosmicus sp.]